MNLHEALLLCPAPSTIQERLIPNINQCWNSSPLEPIIIMEGSSTSRMGLGTTAYVAMELPILRQLALTEERQLLLIGIIKELQAYIHAQNTPDPISAQISAVFRNAPALPEAVEESVVEDYDDVEREPIF